MFVLHSLALLIAFAIVIKMEMVLICNKEKDGSQILGMLENAF